jgi:glucoamylase
MWGVVMIKFRVQRILQLILLMLSFTTLVETAQATERFPFHHKTTDPLRGGACAHLLVGYEDWLQFQFHVTQARLLANISPHDGLAGTVLASPSRRDPDYYFHWVRDGALVMESLLPFLSHARSNGEWAYYRQLFDDFVRLTVNQQNAPAPTGLGEPKFYVDGRPYTDPWGRPQNDGPALRALTLMDFARIITARGEAEYVVANLLDDVITKDLDYVAQRWRDPSFDLWEEELGTHFYTRVVQLQALRAGAQFMVLWGREEKAKEYLEQAHYIELALDGHWDQDAGYIRVTVDHRGGLDSKTSGLDISVVLAALHTSARTHHEYGPTAPRMMATVHRLETTFKEIYAINHSHRFRAQPPLIGRYPEDHYFGGNPWVLATTAMAEYYFTASADLKSSPEIHVNQTNLDFYRSVVSPQVNVGTYSAGSFEYDRIVQALKLRGEQYLARLRDHVPAQGHLAEQMSRENGYMMSAADLTWSYASFLTALRARGRHQ